MASPVTPKMATVKTTTPTAAKFVDTTKTKHPAGVGKSTQAKQVSSAGAVKSLLGKSLSGQQPSGKLTTGQSGTGKVPVGSQSTSSKLSVGQSGVAKSGAAQSSSKGTFKASGSGSLPSGKPSPVHSSPTSKLSLGQSSPRKSIFGKSVGQSGGVKLGTSQSPNKAFFGKASATKSPGIGQFDLPLALRKKRRPNAG